MNLTNHNTASIFWVTELDKPGTYDIRRDITPGSCLNANLHHRGENERILLMRKVLSKSLQEWVLIIHDFGYEGVIVSSSRFDIHDLSK
jgi:hypothetical protein